MLYATVVWLLYQVRTGSVANENRTTSCAIPGTIRSVITGPPLPLIRPHG